MKLRKGFVSNSSTSSFVLIGIPIRQTEYEEKFCTRTKERRCDCELPEGLDINSVPKCPMCGRDAMRERVRRNDEINLGNFEIQEMRDESVFIIIPDSCQYGDEYDSNLSLIPDNIIELKQELKEVLEPMGLWDEGKFGVWSGCEYNG